MMTQIFIPRLQSGSQCRIYRYLEDTLHLIPEALERVVAKTRPSGSL